jgi:hypothetical protein
MSRAHGWSFSHTVDDAGAWVPALPWVAPGARGDAATATAWKKGVSGLWSGNGHWTDGKPNGKTSVTIDAAPVKGSSSYTITITTDARAGNVTLDAASATLVDKNSLTIGTLLSISAGQFDLEGTLRGGVVDVAADAAFHGNGTLTGLTFEGAATSDGSLTIGAAVVFSGIGGTGNATIDGPVTLLGSQTLNDVTINLDVQSDKPGGDDVTVTPNGSAPDVLTIGSDVTINDAESGVAGLIGADQAGDAIVNQGTINITSSGTFIIDATHFTNDGVINVGSDATLLLTGTPAAGTLAALVDSITAGGATAYVAADVMGGVLDADFTSVGTTLSSVTYEGSLTVSLLANAVSNNPDGLTVGAGTEFAGPNGVGAATIDVQLGNLAFDPGSSFDNAHVTLGTIPSGQNLSLELAGLVTGGTGKDAEKLIIGASTTIDAKGGYISAAGPHDTITNDGTIEVSATGAFLVIDALSFVNDGAIDVGAGGDLIVTGDGLDGTLSAAQAQALIGSVTNDGGAVSLAGLVTAGTLNGTVTQVSYENGATLSDVAYQGSLNIEGGYLEFQNGTSFAGAGGVGEAAITVNGGALGWGDSTALANAVVTLAGSGAGSSELEGGSTMVIGTTATINITGNDAHIIASGALVVDGAVNAAASATDIYVDLSGSSIAINGSMDLAGNDNFFVDGTLTNSGSISIGTGSSFTIASELYNALGGSISIGSGGSIDCTGGFLSNLAGGTISLNAAAGAVAAISDGSLLTNSGSIVSSGAGTAMLGSAAANGGVDNTGAITASSGMLQFLGSTINTGTITAAGGAATFSNFVYGTGALDVSGGGTLSLEGGSVATQTVGFLDATGVVELTMPSNFLGTISGFAAGDQIVLENTQETGFGFSGGVLTVTDGTSTVASLHFNGAYSNSSFSVQDNFQAGTVTITHT